MTNKEDLEQSIELIKIERDRTRILLSDREAYIKKLEDAIRKHREQTGNNMCWENDEELWSVLGDGIKIDHTVPSWHEFMTKCAAYRASKDNPRSSNVNWKLVEEMFGPEENWKKSKDPK